MHISLFLCWSQIIALCIVKLDKDVNMIFSSFVALYVHRCIYCTDNDGCCVKKRDHMLLDHASIKTAQKTTWEINRNDSFSRKNTHSRIYAGSSDDWDLSCFALRERYSLQRARDFNGPINAPGINQFRKKRTCFLSPTSRIPRKPTRVRFNQHVRAV